MNICMHFYNYRRGEMWMYCGAWRSSISTISGTTRRHRGDDGQYQAHAASLGIGEVNEWRGTWLLEEDEWLGFWWRGKWASVHVITSHDPICLRFGGDETWKLDAKSMWFPRSYDSFWFMMFVFFWLKSTKASPGSFFRANQSAAIVLFELNVVVGREIENLMFFFSPFKLISNL